MFLDKLLGRPGKGASLASLFLRRALVDAWARGHAEVDVDHVLLGMVALVDVRPMIARRGVEPSDVLAIVDQLLDERPRAEERGPEPPLSPRLKTICERAVVGDRVGLGAMIENLAAALPRELGFARASLTGATPEIASFFSAALSTTPGGELSFAAWSPDMAGIVGLMQKQSDERFKGWALGLYNLFVALLSTKPLYESLQARGIDRSALLEEVGAALLATERGKPKRFSPPAGHVASISPGLYAFFIRAERNAARDRTPVSLRHVLAAFHDEPEYAAAIEKLAR